MPGIPEPIAGNARIGIELLPAAVGLLPVFRRNGAATDDKGRLAFHVTIP